MSSTTLEGREILLAGGSGGLGSAAAELLRSEGARLIVSYRSDAARAEAVRGVTGVVQADLSDAGSRARLLGATPDLYGLAIFAGAPARVAKADELEGAMRRSWETNFAGPVLLAREAAERMRARGSPGAIVLVSTMQAVAVFENSTAYASPKAALLHAARVLAKETRGANIRVNVVAPGVTDAGMAQASIASGKYDRFLTEGVITRFGRAMDVARAVRFFLEPDNYITGQTLTVDGGLTL